MNFVSLAFLLFLFIVIFVLSKTNTIKKQRYILLLASLLFYSWWDIRFTLLLLIAIGVAYVCALKLFRSKLKKQICIIGVVTLLCILGFFKYYNFFVNSFCDLFSINNTIAISVILPVGISFYTFQAISYIADVYYGKIEPVSDFSKVALYISFFPQLVAGPIVRSKDFINQLDEVIKIRKDNLLFGIQIFLFGIIKKVVIADRLAVCVDAVFAAPAQYSAISLISAAVTYSLQIYCDFSGYSDMAIGIARMLGYELCRNFNVPYISKNPTEFWRRWHISLSSWLKDYIYIPLGGNRKGKLRQYINLFVTMLLGGLWHGANWTFVIWGGAHGIALIFHKIFAAKDDKSRNKLMELFSIISTYIFVCICWIFFRAETIGTAFTIFLRILKWETGISYIYDYTLIYAAILIGVHFVVKVKNEGEAFYPILDLNKFFSKFIFCLEIFMILLLSYFGNTAFIYFQF